MPQEPRTVAAMLVIELIQATVATFLVSFQGLILIRVLLRLVQVTVREQMLLLAAHVILVTVAVISQKLV